MKSSILGVCLASEYAFDSLQSKVDHIQMKPNW